ncbi:MAG: hypothetical protein HZB59_04680 [Ignavibacteriales bacterium]|nr:hypothetical protein [Ignavibacteriales bacterium]
MNVILTIDVAHPSRKPEQVEHQLEETLSQVRKSSTLHVIKIIHGQNGKTKQTVRNWAYSNRRRLRGIIYGEDYSVFDEQTQELRKEVGQFSDIDLESSNEGITILWVK